MAKYIKLFETHSEYETYIEGQDAILPNVSYCEDQNDVHYNPYIPDPYNGHEYVEIGGLKWATMNLGANSVTDKGLYFQWGDAQGYTPAQVGVDKTFDWANYKYCDGTESNMTKYNNTDGKEILDDSDDAAKVLWGGAWRIPTPLDIDALIEAVDTEWVADYQGSGISGIICTDKTDSSKVLFLPACGVCRDNVLQNVNYEGHYRLNICGLREGFPSLVGELYLDENEAITSGITTREEGHNIRPVAD